jgi:hypothetical protein
MLTGGPGDTDAGTSFTSGEHARLRASRMQAIKCIGRRTGAGSLPNDGGVELVFLRLHFLHGRRDGRDTFFRANKPKACDQGLVALFSRLFAR